MAVRGLARAALMVWLSVAVSALSIASAWAETRVALVIGNGAYQHTTTLKNPSNDAAQISGALRTLGFNVVEGRDLTRAGFEDKLRAFGRLLPGADVALVFYAGHGLQVGGENWLIPTDAKITSEMDLDLGAIRLATLLKTMERGARVRLIMLDACRDNPMATELAQGLGKRSSSVERGLARVEAGIGTLIAYSTQPGAVAADGRGANSPFATALLGTIATPGVEIREMMSNVRTSVIQATDRAQVPWDHSSLIGDFYFVPSTTQVAALGPTAASKPPVSPSCRRAEQYLETQQDAAGDIDPNAMMREANACLADDPVQGAYLRGVAYGFVGEIDKAVADLTQAISLKSDFAAAYHQRGNFLVQVDFKRANADLAQAIKLDPNNPKIYIDQGYAYSIQLDLTRSRQAFDKAIALDSRSRAARSGLTWTLIRAKRWQEAAVEAQRMLDIMGEDRYATLLRGAAFIGAGEHAKGEADFAAAMAQIPGDTIAYGLRGIAYALSGDCTRALPDLEKVMAGRPFPEARIPRCRCRLSSGDTKGASEDAEILVNEEPYHGEVWFLRGLVRQKQDNHKGAVKDFDKASTLPLEDPVGLYLARAESYSRLGRRKDAVADVQHAQQLQPDRADVKAALTTIGAQ